MTLVISTTEDGTWSSRRQDAIAINIHNRFSSQRIFRSEEVVRKEDYVEPNRTFCAERGNRWSSCTEGRKMLKNILYFQNHFTFQPCLLTIGTCCLERWSCRNIVCICTFHHGGDSSRSLMLRGLVPCMSLPVGKEARRVDYGEPICTPSRISTK